jgi:hypothetical protein
MLKPFSPALMRRYEISSRVSLVKNAMLRVRSL